MTKLTDQDIEKIRQLYAEIGTYAGVSRQTGFAASTVKKYVTGIAPAKSKNSRAEEEVQEVPFDASLLKSFDPSEFIKENWNMMCVLTESEIAKVKELWKEIRT